MLFFSFVFCALDLFVQTYVRTSSFDMNFVLPSDWSSLLLFILKIRKLVFVTETIVFLIQFWLFVITICVKYWLHYWQKPTSVPCTCLWWRSRKILPILSAHEFLNKMIIFGKFKFQFFSFGDVYSGAWVCLYAWYSPFFWFQFILVGIFESSAIVNYETVAATATKKEKKTDDKSKTQST